MKKNFKFNFFLLLFTAGVLSQSCKKNDFIHQPQNPAAFEKKVSIEDLKSLWKGTEYTVPEGLFIEAVVVGESAHTNNGYVYVQEKAASGLMINYTGSAALRLGKKLKISLEGKKLLQENGVFFIDEVTQADSIGTGSIAPAEVTVSEIQNNDATFTALLVALKDVSIEKVSQNDKGSFYEITDGSGMLKAFVSASSSISLPEEANYISGLLTHQDGEIWLTIRRQEDVDAVKPPEYVFFTEDFEKGVYNQVENFDEELGTGSWHFNQGFAAQGANDLKNGSRSARISGKDNVADKAGYVSPNFDFKGLRYISFYFGGAMWGEGGYLDVIRKLDIFISKDQGLTWTKIGTAEAARGEFKKVEVDIDAGVKELVRIKLQNASQMSTATGNQLRINIDDITFSAISKH